MWTAVQQFPNQKKIWNVVCKMVAFFVPTLMRYVDSELQIKHQWRIVQQNMDDTEAM